MSDIVLGCESKTEHISGQIVSVDRFRNSLTVMNIIFKNCDVTNLFRFSRATNAILKFVNVVFKSCSIRHSYGVKNAFFKRIEFTNVSFINMNISYLFNKKVYASQIVMSNIKFKSCTGCRFLGKFITSTRIVLKDITVENDKTVRLMTSNLNVYKAKFENLHDTDIYLVNPNIEKIFVNYCTNIRFMANKAKTWNSLAIYNSSELTFSTDKPVFKNIESDCVSKIAFTSSD